MESNTKQGYYVNPNYSLSVSTQAGNICDLVGAKNIGLWDPHTFQNLSFVIDVVPSDSFVSINSLGGGKGNRVVVYSADRFTVIDFDLPIGQRIIWQKTENLDDIRQIATTFSQPNEIYALMQSGDLKVWDIETKQVTKTIKLIRKMYSKLQVFPGGNHFLLQNTHGAEYNLVERNSGIQQRIPLKSAAITYLVLSEVLFCVIFKNFFVVYDISKGPGSIFAVVKSEDDTEVFETASVINNQKWVAFAGERGVLRIWDIQNFKSPIYQFDLNKSSQSKDSTLPQITHINNIVYLDHASQPRFAIINTEKRHMRLFKAAPATASSEEYTSQFEFVNSVNGTLKNLDSVIQIDSKKVIAITSFGIFDEESVFFKSEMQLIEIETRNVLAMKTLYLPKFSLVSNSIQVDSESGQMFYLMRNEDTDDGLFLKLDIAKLVECVQNNTDTDSALSAHPFAVEQKGKHSIFLQAESRIPRIIVPFNVKYQNNSIPLGFATFKESCGLSVYDFAVKRIWTHEFAPNADFIVKHAAMIDSEHIVFVDPKSNVEIWNITNNEQVASNQVDHPIKKLYAFANRMLILDDKNVAHFYTNDTFEAVCSIPLIANQNIVSVHFAGGQDDANYYVVYSNEQLQRINTENETTTVIKSMPHGAQRISVQPSSSDATTPNNFFILKEESILFTDTDSLN